MKVTFILPGPGYKPSGGFRVIYEYANRLAAKRHKVNLIHAPPFLEGNTSMVSHVRRCIHYVTRKIGMFNGWRPDSWFRLNSEIHLHWRPSLAARWIPEGDVVVATAWQTAEFVYSCPGSKGQKFYFIQDYEKYFPGSIPERVDATWKLPLNKIVTAKWLAGIARDFGEEAIVIPCGLDFEAFAVDQPIEQRNPFHVVMLYHEDLRKGSVLGIEALKVLRTEVPELVATLFGTFPRPVELPAWMNYCHLPNRKQLRKVYNDAAIYMSPSLVEGWGLPCCEAAQCGAALCVTDVGGHREYAIPHETALVCPPNDTSALKEIVKTLIYDNQQRIALARNANVYMQRYSWDNSVDLFEKLLVSGSEGAMVGQ